MKCFSMILSLFLLLISFSALTNYSQTPEKWTKIESKDQSFSIAMPTGFGIFANEQGFSMSNPSDIFNPYKLKNLRSMTIYQNGALLWTDIYETKNAVKVMDFLVSSNNFGESSVKKVTFEGFTGYEIKDKSNLFNEYYFADKTKIYYIGAKAKNTNNLLMTSFLASLNLRGKYPYTGQAKREETNETLIIDDIRITPIAFEIADKTLAAQLDVSPPAESNIEPLKFLTRPSLEYTDAARRNKIQGKVRIHTEFLANGTIGKVTVIQGLENGITENAVRALRRTKFFPAEKAGVPVTVTKIIEYSFSVY